MGILSHLWQTVGMALGEKHCPLCLVTLTAAEMSVGICTACQTTLTEEAALCCPHCGHSVTSCDCIGLDLSPVPTFLCRGNEKLSWLAHTWYVPARAELSDLHPERRTEKLLLTCKTKQTPALARYIASEMAAELSPLLPRSVRRQWRITYPPRSSNGYTQNGFDQCEEIVRQLGEMLGIRTVSYLTRIGGSTQKSLKDSQMRYENMRNAFSVVQNPAGYSILLFDDILTTGATMRSAAHTLIQAGAKTVFPIAFAKTLYAHQN